MMKKIQLFVLVITLALSAAFTIANNSTDLDDNFKGNSQASNERIPKPVDCEEVRLNGNQDSGVYTIWPRNRKMAGKSIQVYCDMKTDGGGWTVLQRRGNFKKPMNYFHKSWEFYKNGFGQVEKDFWIGNDVIFALTNQGVYSVRFDMSHVDGRSAYALYDMFWIEDEEEKYQLYIDGYSGNAGDSMIAHNGMKFSTHDKDNDLAGGNCAAVHTGGWWFKACADVHFNGMYRLGKYEGGHEDGIFWEKFSGKRSSLEFTEIKIRPY